MLAKSASSALRFSLKRTRGTGRFGSGGAGGGEQEIARFRVGFIRRPEFSKAMTQ